MECQMSDSLIGEKKKIKTRRIVYTKNEWCFGFSLEEHTKFRYLKNHARITVFLTKTATLVTPKFKIINQKKSQITTEERILKIFPIRDFENAIFRDKHFRHEI